MFTTRTSQVAVAAILMVAIAMAIETLADDPGAAPAGARAPLRLPDEGRLPSLAGASAWLGAPPLTSTALRGKVVLVQFWTYSCINWLRTLPHVRAWSEKYAASGLVVIGVHTPEFEFEKDLGNVRRAVRDLAVSYPVAVDSDRAIWGAFGNQYWPALYFIDAEGRIRHHHFGEGDFERSERVIRELLAEAGHPSAEGGLVAVDGRGAEAAADWSNLRSPENYVGHVRTQGFASPGGIVRGKRHRYAAPEQVALNRWALSGDWTIGAEATLSNEANGRIVYRFHARDLHAVLGPHVRGSSVRFRVLLDGRPPGAAHGADVDEQGNGTVTEQRLYQLIRQPRPIEERQLDIELLDPGLEAFSFTFG